MPDIEHDITIYEGDMLLSPTTNWSSALIGTFGIETLYLGDFIVSPSTTSAGVIALSVGEAGRGGGGGSGTFSFAM